MQPATQPPHRAPASLRDTVTYCRTVSRPTLDAASAPEVVLTFAVVAGHADRAADAVDDDDRVEAIGLARVVFDGFAGAEGASHRGLLWIDVARA